MASKSIFIPTNFNNKLHCNCMIHIDIAPRTTIPESTLEKSVIEFQTQDNSYPPTSWKLIDLSRVTLNNVNSVYTWQSHAMDAFDWITWFKGLHPDLNSDTPLAIYYYKKQMN